MGVLISIMPLLRGCCRNQSTSKIEKKQRPPFCKMKWHAHHTVIWRVFHFKKCSCRDNALSKTVLNLMSTCSARVNQQPPMDQLAVLSTGCLAFFHSAPDGVHNSSFLFYIIIPLSAYWTVLHSVTLWTGAWESGSGWGLGVPKLTKTIYIIIIPLMLLQNGPCPLSHNTATFLSLKPVLHNTGPFWYRGAVSHNTAEFWSLGLFLYDMAGLHFAHPGPFHAIRRVLTLGSRFIGRAGGARQGGQTGQGRGHGRAARARAK